MFGAIKSNETTLLPRRVVEFGDIFLFAISLISTSYQLNQFPVEHVNQFNGSQRDKMTQEVKLRRSQCNYSADNARFLLDCDFSKQYYNYYRRRFERARPFLILNCKSKWGTTIPIYSLVELASITNFVFDEVAEPFSPVLSPDSQTGLHIEVKRRRHFSDCSSDVDQRGPDSSTQEKNVTRTGSAGKLAVPLHSPILGNEDQDSACIIIGTIFKRMKLQPNVVEELSKGDYHVNCERYVGHYLSQDDKLVLEDYDESIALVGNINPKHYVTGVVIGLLGVPMDDGSQFLVQDVCFPEANRQVLYAGKRSQSYYDHLERPLKNLPSIAPIYLMVVSGLGFYQDMGKGSSLTQALQNLIDFIWGGGKYSEDERSSQVARILVAGDSLSQTRLSNDVDPSQSNDDLAAKMKKSRQVKPFKGSIQSIKYMDDFLAQLSKTIDVDLMPGPSDPSSHLMPQQPFHPCMFPKSSIYPTFNCTTNPHHATYDGGVEVLATSGQNIDIIEKFSALSDPIQIMKCHLKWGNCAPSAPDNLYSVPYEHDDPFIINFVPEIYIAGCQESFTTDYFYYTFPSTNETHSSQRSNSSDINETHQQLNLNSSLSSSNQGEGTSSMDFAGPIPVTPNQKDRTLLVTVPRFDETFSCVLINLKTLDCHELSFN